MKKIMLVLSLTVLVVAACTKSNEAPTTTLNETIPPDTSSNGGGAAGTNAKYAGNFQKGPYGTVSGSAKIYMQNGKLTLALENVTISNGPDLHVYLSQEVQPINFIDLGKLKSIYGNQLYDINGTPDFTVYKYALIHCQQYNHLFGSAELK